MVQSPDPAIDEPNRCQQASHRLPLHKSCSLLLATVLAALSILIELPAGFYAACRYKDHDAGTAEKGVRWALMSRSVSRTTMRISRRQDEQMCYQYGAAQRLSYRREKGTGCATFFVPATFIAFQWPAKVTGTARRITKHRGLSREARDKGSRFVRAASRQVQQLSRCLKQVGNVVLVITAESMPRKQRRAEMMMIA